MSSTADLAANAPDVEADLTAIRQSRLYNPDLAPVSRANRKWGMLSFAALWISMSACIPTYMLASGLIDGGMNWWQAILTIFLGNLIVVIPMILNAHAGTKYGIPFPVFCRASFGTRGANVPAVLRALVACGWFGIQTWIGGDAIYKILSVFWPTLASGSTSNFWGLPARSCSASCFSGASTCGSSTAASIRSASCSISKPLC
jgi:nucleobase:cation symporter-1, NCS1 family